MAMVWNVKFDWLGNLFIGFSQRLKYRNTGRHDGHWWHLCEGVHPVDCIHVLLLDDKIASLLSVVMPGSRCTCKHKRGWEVLRKRGVRNKQVSLSLSRTVIPDTLKRCVEIIKHKQNTVSQVCVNIPRGRCLKTGLFNIKTMAERMRNFCCTTCMDCVAHILTYTQTHARTFRCSYHFVE